MSSSFKYLLIVLVAFSLSGSVCVPTMVGGKPKLNDIQLPLGFELSIFAENITNARAMCWGDNGTLFVGSRSAGNVYALRDKDGDGQAEVMYTIASGLSMPVGVAFKDGDLYISVVNGVVKLIDIEEHLDDPPAPVVVTDAYPSEKHHGWKFIAFGPDGKLYIPVGAPCNICESPDSIFASITRINSDGSGREIIAHGVRNSVGFDWDPNTGKLWFTENGRDNMGDDVPNCELNVLNTEGEHFGYPYCHEGSIPDPEFGEILSCHEFVPPAAKLGPHVAPLGMRFYRGDQFPAKYKHAIFIAEHGSWNRTTPIGYRVAVAFPQADGSVNTEIFAEGWLKGSSATGRPVDVLEAPDGSLLVSDDDADMIYRITYTAP
ncbi:MAG: sorbosone dehydrogenase family protein [Flavobacteriales bacterium]|nr:sorbosone dehydrogenase family protein [Flavobacteriales bacterium]